MSTEAIHYGTMISSTGTAILFKLRSGITIAVLWEYPDDPPRQAWWNDKPPEWTTIEDVMHKRGNNDKSTAQKV